MFNPGGGGSMNKMIKQAKKMQEEMAKMQEELQEREIEAAAGGGVVNVVINGKQELISIKINPEAVDPEDVEMLEDLIIAAVNEGIRKSQEMVSTEMGKITGGLNIPGL
ncbi:MAG TPA: YbaB/EbfC family nucleoid-associated protein [Syntrophomonadaceae bacterium]|nr:YbaB/EbfC family nucleoid-associated protein [Syntrophomonadaceae bacterium]